MRKNFKKTKIFSELVVFHIIATNNKVITFKITTYNHIQNDEILKINLIKYIQDLYNESYIAERN